MNRTGKLLLVFLIISCVLNVALLVSLFNPIRALGTSQRPVTGGEVSGRQDVRSEDYGGRTDASQIDRRIREQRPPFKMLNASPTEYLGKSLTLLGYATLSTYYNYGYMYAGGSHYSVRLTNLDAKSVTIYFPKEKNRKLFELLGQASRDQKIALRVQAVVGANRYEGESQFLAEGLGWEVLK